MYKEFGIKDEVVNLAEKVEKDVAKQFEEVNKRCELNSLKVLRAFNKYNISDMHFGSTTGYGYGDVGRDIIEKVFADVLGAEDCLVRSQFISGTHALTVALFAFLRPGDKFISISGKPYDTLDEVIGIVPNNSSLKAFGVEYEQIDLIDDDFDYEKIRNRFSKNDLKLVEIQRSRGYSLRKSITMDKIEKVIETIRCVNKDVIIMVDNCYGEFVDDKEPINVGADIMVGSLIKNLGGGIAPNGAYVAGRSDLVDLVAERLTVPGQGAEVGPSMDMNKKILQGLYMAPSVVASSLKTNIFASLLLSELGFSTNPKYNEEHVDIVLAITFNNSDKLIKYVEGIAEYSAIDNYVKPIPSDMPGYSDKIIMASGSFINGSSIEISCDGPIREPFIAYQQGSLTYQYGRLAVINAVGKIYEK